MPPSHCSGWPWRTTRQRIPEPGAEASLYRQNAAAVRLRVIDRRFEGMAKSRRHGDVWQFLSDRVPADMLADVSVVLTGSPAELRHTRANLERERPTP